VLRILVLSVSQHSRHFVGVSLPIIGCFETLEAYIGAMHPNIECFKALDWCYAACNLVSRNTKLVLHRLLLSVSKHFRPMLALTELF